MSITHRNPSHPIYKANYLSKCNSRLLLTGTSLYLELDDVKYPVAIQYEDEQELEGVGEDTLILKGYERYEEDDLQKLINTELCSVDETILRSFITNQLKDLNTDKDTIIDLGLGSMNWCPILLMGDKDERSNFCIDGFMFKTAQKEDLVRVLADKLITGELQPSGWLWTPSDENIRVKPVGGWVVSGDNIHLLEGETSRTALHLLEPGTFINPFFGTKGLMEITIT